MSSSNIENSKLDDDVSPIQLSSNQQSLQPIKTKAGYSTSYVNQKQVNYGYSQKVFIPKGGNNYGAPRPLSSFIQNYGPSQVQSLSAGLSHNRIVGGLSGNKVLRNRFRTPPKRPQIQSFSKPAPPPSIIPKLGAALPTPLPTIGLMALTTSTYFTTTTTTSAVKTTGGQLSNNTLPEVEEIEF